MSAIVTCASNRIAYNIVHSLGSKGIRIVTGDFFPLSMSFASRYSKAHFLYPSPFTKQEKFIESIIRNIEKYKTKVLIPVFEETFLISKYRETLSKITNLVVPEYKNILIAHNKDIWEQTAKKLKIPVPKSYEIKKIRKNLSNLKYIRFPALIKPKQGGGAWGITEFENIYSIYSVLGQNVYVNLPWHRFILQEKIKGDNFCVAMLFRHGEMRAKIAYKQIRDYPLSGGQATLRISVRNEKAENYLEKLLKELKWHGICQADFIVEEKSNIPYLIDLNPRFWGSLVQGIASGVDFPYLTYKMAIDGDIKIKNDFKTGVATRWIGGDFRTFYDFLKSKKNRKESICKFIFPRLGKIYYDDFKIDDPMPIFVWFADVFLRAIRKHNFNAVAHETLPGIWD